jgi:DNA polymerase I-like protein with 3'-5' exonuclease and polymerase domains
MQLITVDLETFYSKEYSLSKLTTEQYIRDPRFQVIGASVKVDDAPAEWFSGPAKETLAFLRSFEMEKHAVLCQNTMFDGAILSWRCGIRPKRLLDTMCMSRALHGVNARHSLAALAERYGVGTKGTEVLRAIGKRRLDFTARELAEYGAYCVKDTELTHAIFMRMLAAGFPKAELQLIDLTLRMFTEPVLELDVPHLEGHLQHTLAAKQQMLTDAGVGSKKDLMSNPKFADMLRALGVEPPTKISDKTGKEAYAMAKTDEAFVALAEHEDIRVQTLMAARLGNKSTIEETRTQRFIGIGKRGSLPIPLRYYAAHTGRWGGTDKLNLQNLPSRGPNAKQIKKAIRAGRGYVIIECDSSQIEARVLAWLAGQEDLIAAFARKDDVYKLMASKLFGVDIDDVDKGQRQIGKVVVLGCGYGIGHIKLQVFLKLQAGVVVSLDEAKRIIDVYRFSNDRISQLWKDAQNTLKHLALGDRLSFGRPGVLDVDPSAPGIILPNGLPILYDGLRAEQGEKGYEYLYDTRQGPKRIYGGACVENVTQALARIVVGEQMLKISKRYRPVLTVHDSVVSCVPEAEADEAREYIETCMRWTPAWATGLPVNCESGVGTSYGACE